MPRRPRRTCWTDAACYHVMNRGQNRATIFADDNDRHYFLGLLARYRQRFDVHLYHYCLLDNHFHLLLQLAQPRQLSRLMASMLVAYARRTILPQLLGTKVSRRTVPMVRAARTWS